MMVSWIGTEGERMRQSTYGLFQTVNYLPAPLVSNLAAFDISMAFSGPAPLL